MNNLVYDDLVRIMSKISDVMTANKDYLCLLDAQMGDGDLGITMHKGWLTAAETAKSFEETDIGKMLIKAGLRMASAAPSTMGTILAAGLMDAGKNMKGETKLDIKGLSRFLNGFCDGLMKRGHCSPGDRTVLDSVWPAAKAVEQIDERASMKHAAALVRSAAREGLELTKDMVPKFGRAAIFAAKAKGILDQGAVVGFLMVDTICTYIEAER